jgi:hypothetical protein
MTITAHAQHLEPRLVRVDRLVGPIGSERLAAGLLRRGGGPLGGGEAPGRTGCCGGRGVPGRVGRPVGRLVGWRVGRRVVGRARARLSSGLV